MKNSQDISKDKQPLTLDTSKDYSIVYPDKKKGLGAMWIEGRLLKHAIYIQKKYS